MIDFFTHWHSQLFEPDRIPTILAAWLLTVIIGMISGPLFGNCNPFIWQVYSRLIGNFGDKLDKTKRPKADLMFRGFLVSVFALVIALGFGRLYQDYVPLNLHFGIWPIIGLSALMSSGALWYSLLQLYFAMEKKQPSAAAFQAISTSTRRYLGGSDEYGVTRAAISLSARHFDKALIGPALWYLIGGFPAAIIYSTLAALSWRFGKSGFHSGFAAAPVALEKLMGFVPNLFAACLLNLAAFITPTAKLFKSLTAWLGVKGRATYEQGGFPLSALAWSLNVSLGGAKKDLSGSAIKGEWVGPPTASAKIEHAHLRRAIYISVIANILFAAAFLGAYVWSGILGVE